MGSVDPYEEYQQGLIQVHRALSEGLQALVTAPLRERAHGIGGFLLGHHHVESSILFPGLRRHGHLRSTDVAFLDAREKEHRDLHSLAERLPTQTDEKEIAKIASEILLQLTPHVAEEERGLAPENLRLMISEAGLREIGREVEEMRRAHYAVTHSHSPESNTP